MPSSLHGFMLVYFVVVAHVRRKSNGLLLPTRMLAFVVLLVHAKHEGNRHIIVSCAHAFVLGRTRAYTCMCMQSPGYCMPGRRSPTQHFVFTVPFIKSSSRCHRGHLHDNNNKGNNREDDDDDWEMPRFFYFDGSASKTNGPTRDTAFKIWNRLRLMMLWRR